MEGNNDFESPSTSSKNVRKSNHTEALSTDNNDFATPSASSENPRQSNSSTYSSATVKGGVADDRLFNKKNPFKLNNCLASMEYQDKKSGNICKFFLFNF